MVFEVYLCFRDFHWFQIGFDSSWSNGSKMRNSFDLRKKWIDLFQIKFKGCKWWLWVMHKPGVKHGQKWLSLKMKTGSEKNIP